MTAPGFQINPADLHNHASQRRFEAEDFIADKPPELPADEDDPTVGVSRDLQDDVHGVNHGMRRKSHHKAGMVDGAGLAFAGADGSGGTVGTGGSQLAKAVDLGGVGSIMNSIIGPIGQITSGVAQGISGLAAGLSQGAANLGGQTISGGAGLIGNLAKNVTVHDEPAIGGVVGGGAGGGEKATRDRSAAFTSKSGGPEGPGAGPSPGGAGVPQGYAHTEQQDHDDTGVHPAGMSNGAGLAPTGGISPSPAAKVHKAKVALTLEQPAEVDVPLRIAAVRIPSPL
jgi:hypothetical protein